MRVDATNASCNGKAKIGAAMNGQTCVVADVLTDSIAKRFPKKF